MELVQSVSGELRSSELQLVLRSRRHLVIYNPLTQELMLRRADAPQLPWNGIPRDLASPPLPLASGGAYACPMCHRPWDTSGSTSLYSDAAMMYGTRSSDPERYLEADADEFAETAPQYFQLLSESANVSTRATSPEPSVSPHVGPESANQGYYERFFVELGKLGRGARGSVYLCQHVLYGHALGRYAIKKIPVGDQRCVGC